MSVAVDQLPSDPEHLRAIIVEQTAALAAQEAELHARDLPVEKLKAQLAVLHRRLPCDELDHLSHRHATREPVGVHDEIGADALLVERHIFLRHDRACAGSGARGEGGMERGRAVRCGV